MLMHAWNTCMHTQSHKLLLYSYKPAKNVLCAITHVQQMYPFVLVRLCLSNVDAELQ